MSPNAIPPGDRDKLLPNDWRGSTDVAWTTSGDADGLHIMTAAAKAGYAWQTIATLAEPGLDADMWIGNACATGNGKKLVVVYAPRTFTNNPVLFDRGGFTAVVDLTTGAVTKLGVRTTLAYFNPGCGTGDSAVVTQAGDEDLGQTRLLTVDTASAAVGKPIDLPGQVTSAIPVDDGIAAADGKYVVKISGNGTVTPVAAAANVPFALHADQQGGINFLDRTPDQNRAARVDGKGVSDLAFGPAGKVGLTADTAGRVYVTGAPASVRPLPSAVSTLDVPVNASLSTHGGLAVLDTLSAALANTVTGPAAGRAAPAANPTDDQVQIKARVLTSRHDVDFTVSPAGAHSEAATSGRNAAPGATAQPHTASRLAPHDSSGDPVDENAVCAVPRNDVNTQVYQPLPRQVTWAVDRAVNSELTFTRQANWKNDGIGAYSPQGMFPSIPLTGGGTVPATVMLGILSQESNEWQASRHTPEGTTGNAIIGSYYGIPYGVIDAPDKWTITFASSDCGYGIGQVTDGMRKPGTEKPGQAPALLANQQRAIALDYAANIAAGLRILESKWNQVQAAGIKINNNDPSRPENWYAAIWAYNSGVNPDTHDGQPWGLGWLNNPANPHYNQNRESFLDTQPSDAAHPGDWPYQEKVLGFAAHSIAKDSTPTGAGFSPAWWNTNADRTTVEPPVTQFCTTANQCLYGQKFPPNDPSVLPGPGETPEPDGPCAHKSAAGLYDLRCFWSQPTTWKANCDQQCGHDIVQFDLSAFPNELPDGTGFPPDCSTAGLPSNALIVDDTTAPSVRPNCPAARNSGSFSMSFNGASSDGTSYLSKIDLQQLGVGFGGHTWFAHTWEDSVGDLADKFGITGTWRLGQALNGWSRVMVHLPDLGAQTQQALYKVNLGNGTVKTRSVLQNVQQNKWVSLGVFQFAGVPSVSLSNVDFLADGSEDISWDAIAFQPLPGKPANVVVSLGDSFSSGEGASSADGADYYTETNTDGQDAMQADCHRSKYSWSRKAQVPGASGTIGALADQFSPTEDYQFLACSGAVAMNLLPTWRTIPSGGVPHDANGNSGTGQYRELPQMDAGYIDENTTLVTLTIGGNDARFTPVFKACLLDPIVKGNCQDNVLEGDTQPLKVAEPNLINGPMKDSVTTVLTEIQKRAPLAKVVLLGYPQMLAPFDSSGGAVSNCLLMPKPEVDWLNDLAVVMNGALKAAVDKANFPTSNTFKFQDPTSYFANRGLCGANSAFNPIVGTFTAGEEPNPLGVGQQSLHPTKDGTTLYANALQDALKP